jgi:hypothetical protein
MSLLEGHCLCGAVTLRAGSHGSTVSACHCAMCRRWTGAAMLVFEAAAEDLAVSGPVKTYRSSDFAERAWCALCGTHLWIRDDGKDFELMPGLFDAARDMPLTREVYADRAFACVTLAGDHPRLTATEYEADHRFVEGTA